MTLTGITTAEIVPEKPATSPLGEPISRVDGHAKVTGAAKFSAEFEIPNLAYGALILSTIPSGRITSMDTAGAEQVDGVIKILTPSNATKLAAPQSRITTLQDDKVHYNNQPIGIVVAETLQAAIYAASIVRVRYEKTEPKLDFEASFPTSYPGSHNDEPGDLSWGDVDQGLKEADVTVDAVYTTPIEHHNPMEPHAIIAQWEGSNLTVHDSTQNISGRRNSLAQIFGVPPVNVRVVALFIGGGFGCKGQIWSHVVIAAMAAKQTNRPVKVALERPQMFGSVGARPQTHQHITLGAKLDGKLTAIRHEVHAHTSEIEDYLESSAFPTRVMYACENISTIHRLVKLNLGTPTYTRAPGVATGTYALEVAMDELAYKLKMDPLQLRLANYTEVDPHSKKPFTEKHLRECYRQAAEKFGWSKRNPAPRSMRDGSQLIGWGMATETYPGNRLPASARVTLQPDGRVLVQSGTHELGTGMYTIMVQVAADALALPTHLIDAHLGDTTLPPAPISAGSMSTASVTPAVQAAALDARKKLLTLASADKSSPLYQADAAQLEFRDGKIFRTGAPDHSENFTALLARNGNNPVEGFAHTEPNPKIEDGEFSSHSFGAIFAEVSVDPYIGMTRVRRVVAVYDVGKLLNEKTGHSQFIGGIVWGIGLALTEDTLVDPRDGRIANANLAEYHLPVNADIGEINVSALNIPDPEINPLGARGIGEIGITGTAAAIANAIYHATGIRVRDVPITPDKLLT
jgi:xanthine dehydrogenase YagR molybdenum-binding subunit